MKSSFLRVACLALALCLLMPTALAEGTNANFYAATDYADVNGSSLAGTGVAGDTLYLLTTANRPGESEESLERWKPGMEAPEVVLTGLKSYSLEEETTDATVVNRLFSDGESLYGLDYGYHEDKRAAVTRLVDGQGIVGVTPLCTVDVAALNLSESGYEEMATLINVFAVDGVLTMLGVFYTANGSEYVFTQYDLSTGETLRQSKEKTVFSLCPYKDGAMLALVRPESKPDEPTAPVEIARYDPVAGTLETLVKTDKIEMCGIGYNAESDTAYYVSGATVYALPGVTGEARVSAYLPISAWMEQPIAYLDGGMIVHESWQGAYVRALDAPGIGEGALVIYGEGGSNKHAAVVDAHPELPITMSDSYYGTMEQLTAAMVGGEDTVDVLRLAVETAPVERLIQKGYAADLSGYPELMAVVRRMDAPFSEVLCRDGKLYGVPVNVSGGLISVNKEVMEALELTQDDLPSTYMELLDFAANFYYDYGEEHQDIALFDNPRMRDELFEKIMAQYIALQMRAGEAVQFDTPLMRKLLVALDAIDFTELDPYATLGDEAWDNGEMDEFYEKRGLFSMYTSVSPRSFGFENLLPLVLPLDEGMEPIVPMNMDILIVNPRSAHMDQAAVYLAEYVKHYDAADENLMLFPDENDPVPNPYYEMSKLSWEENIRELDERLEKADESEKAALREERKTMEEYLADVEKHRISVTAEMLAAYRERVAPYVYVARQTPLTDWGSETGGELRTQINQYNSGAIDVETFIREVDKRVRMMMLEDQ
ncbi:MAG: hypothetical protein MRZ54_04440 [Clostridiales bacterium]|nr:hypothetical protein [Clostridiales bacterium]